MNLKAPKRIVTFCAALLLPLLSWQNASSQPPVYNPVQYANLALRTFFSTVTNPNPSISFLYDMSSHIVDSNYFGPFVTDTNFTENWYSLFEEMYNSAYDTNPLVRVSDVEFLASQQNITTNMIPMGIVDWDYNLLKADALSTGTYFDFDLINNIITDKPGASSAYTIENVFSCAPLEKYAYFSNPTFLIDPQYIFQDAYKVDSPPLEINFDDGSGWHAFDWHLSTTYVASYPSAGAKYIEYRYTTLAGEPRYAIAHFVVLNDEPAHASTQTLDLPGLTATFFGPAGCTFNADTKYVIYVEGIDILERRTAYIIYHQMIYLEKLSQLKNFGYTFVVVDWKDSHAPLEQNSAHLRGLIEWLKCNGHPTGPKPNMPPPFVVIGESMGGLIARHALTFMEHNYMNTNLPLGCSPSYGHNTRLFISLDAPQQGANVPMGLQYIYKYINSSLLPINAYTLGALNRYVNLINGSAKEMLLYHVDTDQFPNIDVSSSSFNPHPAKLAFDANLAALGSYPTMCKMMTMSNGSARGEMQQRRWDNMARVPNDKMLDGHAEVTLRILGIRFNGSEFDVLIRTNPNGNGDLFYLKQSTAKWKIKLHWFGIKLQWTVKATREINKVGQSMIPYCVSPGSTQGYVPDDKSKSFNFLDLFGYGYSITPGSGGTLTVNASAGMGPIWNVSGNVAAYSDGGEFGFIPTQSALDYKNAPSLIHDIVTEPVATTLSRTPFDVVQLNPEKAGIYNIANRNHLYVENPVLTGSNSYDYIKCTTCLTMGYPIKSYMLNREIGDDTLFLENQNQSLPFTVIEAERSLQVNYRSPYYNYDGIPSPRPQFEISLTSSGDYAVKSKANPFAITNTSGANKLRSNDQFIINGSLPGTWQYQLGGMTICCINYTVPNARMQTSQNNYNNHPRNTSAINVYPNPNSTGSVTVKYQFKENGPVQIELYDVSGRKLGMWSPNFSDNSLESHFPIPVPVSAGVYLLKANNGKEQLTARLIVIQ